jgi:hypothetical protein
MRAESDDGSLIEDAIRAHQRKWIRSLQFGDQWKDDTQQLQQKRIQPDEDLVGEWRSISK